MPRAKKPQPAPAKPAPAPVDQAELLRLQQRLYSLAGQPERADEFEEVRQQYERTRGG